MIKTVWLRIYAWFLKAVYTQGVLALIYIPIAIGWGLPVSLACLIGNLLLTAWLGGFLILCTCNVLAHMANPSCQWTCMAVEWYSASWLTILRLGTPDWLIGCPNPGNLVLLATSMCGLGMVWITRRLKLELRIAIVMLFLTVCLTAYTLWPRPSSIRVMFDKTPILLTLRNNAIDMIVPPLHTRGARFKRWCTFQLIPTLYKTWGSTTINRLMLIHPSKNFQASMAQNRALSYKQLIIIANDRRNRQSLLPQ